MFNSKTPFRLIGSRARKLIERLEEQLRSGQISTRSEFAVQLLGSMQRFTSQLRAPTLRVPQMKRDDPLRRELVELPLQQAAEDLEEAFGQVELLRKLNGQIANLMLTEQQGLASRLAGLTAQTDRFRLWVSDSPVNYVWVGDTLNDLSLTDPSTTAWVDTAAGIASLQPESSRSLSDRVKSVTIDRDFSRGGLPGNNLEVQSTGTAAFTGGRPEPLPVLYGETVVTDDVTAILDGKPDTWFEWEKTLVPLPQPVMSAGFAYIYDPAGKSTDQLPALGGWRCFLQWPGESTLDTGEGRQGYPLVHFLEQRSGTGQELAAPEDPVRKRTGKNKKQLPGVPAGPSLHRLQLGLLLELEAPARVSWIQLTPLIRGGAYPQVSQILLSADGEHWKPLLHEPATLHPRMNRGIDFQKYGAGASNFEGLGVWMLPSTPIRFVKVLLSQERDYQCPLGIGHYFEVKASNKELQKSAGLSQQGLWKKLNVAKRVTPPVPVAGSSSSAPGDGSGRAQAAVASRQLRGRKQILGGYDLFQARRLAIGIRDLLLEERTYTLTSRFVSKALTFQRPVKAAALMVSEKIPDGWAPRQSDGSRWITYEISPDGTSWSPLIPQETELADSVVEFAAPTTKVWFRATFTRPEELENESPALLAYGIKGLPA